jgi:hypothetical protein
VIRGGYNVYPREIEEVMYEHPAVREEVGELPKRPTGRILKREIELPCLNS